MFTKIRRYMRRCPVCRSEVDHQGIRKGWRYFCSPEHAEIFQKEQALRQSLRNRGHGGGCCC